MGNLKAKGWPNSALLLGGLFLLSFLIIFQLYRHPETALLLLSLPSPEAFACNLRCLGIMPFLQVLGEAGKAILLVFMSFAFFYALSRTALRILRTLAFVDRAERNAAPNKDVARFSFLENVTVFEDHLPLAFTAGFLKPRVFISTKLVDILDEKELRAVILHESHHQRSKDPLKGLVVSFISDFLFFLPVSGFLKKTFHLTSELTADAYSINSQVDPLDLVSSLLKVQKLNGPAASWFFDPTAERAKHLLGQPARLSLPLRKTFLTIILLAISSFIALIPVKKSVSSLFINHDKTCVLRSGLQ
ncbi:MAG: M56 family metallopeptidase [Candidatus Aminicenantes bacterium]|nr:M56 family metallopeptidase [Candidatus Aminicenantes bacterium]